MLRRGFGWRAVLVVLAATMGQRGLAAADPAPASSQGESVEQAICRLIDGASKRQNLPVSFLTRVIWQESSFRPHVISPAGAQGVAQFMPGTAMERGLNDPFDPEQAIPAAASFLAELSVRFGNLGLAAAAYNGGPARVQAFLQGTGGLPLETRDYVERTTGHAVEYWTQTPLPKEAPDAAAPTCLQLASTLRQTPGGLRSAEAPFAPWGVQLAGNFSKSLALATFARARRSYQSVLGDVRPMIIGTRLRTRGFRAFYRVRVPAPSREAADVLCRKIHTLQGACLVLRS